MIAMRTLLMFGFLFVLSGCAEWPQVGSPCPKPGSPSAAHRNCWYYLTVNTIDEVNNRVSGTDVNQNRFTFRVKEVEMLKRTNQLREGTAYVFGSVSNSAYLELYTDEALTSEMKGTAKEN